VLKSYARVSNKFDLSLLPEVMSKEPILTLQRLWAKMRFAKPLSEFAESVPCFFVLSTGRTGTLTMARLLNLGSEAYVYHEPNVVLFALGKLAYMSANSHKDILGQAFLTSHWSLFKHSLACGRGYGETGNCSTFLAPVISESLPASRFIHLVREPQAFVRSAMRRNWYQGAMYDDWRILPRAGTAEAGKWGEWSAFEKNIWLWQETNRCIREFCDGLGNKRYLRIYSEDFFGGDFEIIRKIFAFLGLTLPRKRRIEKVMSRKLNKQRKGEFKRPQDWDSGMQEKLLEIAGPEMKRLGYGADL